MPLTPVLGLFQFLEHGHRFTDLLLEVAPHEVQQLVDQRVAYGIENLVAGLPRDHDLAGSQNREMLRKVGLFEVEAIGKCAGRQFALAQQIENRSAWDGPAPGKFPP